MLKALWTKFLARRSAKYSLASILAEPDNREILLGVKRSVPPSPEKMNEDVGRIIRYSTTEDYSIWAKEAWTTAISCIDQLVNDELDQTKVDFYRGSLATTLDLLRFSYKARFLKEDAVNASHRQK